MTFPHLFAVSLTNLSPVCLVPNAVTCVLFYITVVSTSWAVYVGCGNRAGIDISRIQIINSCMECWTRSFTPFHWAVWMNTWLKTMV